MSRKMSAYSRKRMHRPPPNGAEFLNVIQKCRAYTDEPIPGSWLPGTQDAADGARNRANRAVGSLARGAWPDDDTELHDILAHVIGVTIIRCLEIGGENPNPMRLALAGNEALKSIRARWREIGKWGATRNEQLSISAAVEVYEAILQASSPAQMTHAADQRMKVLEQQAATIGKPVTA